MAIRHPITSGFFPRQGIELGREVVVSFQADPFNQLTGTVVRSDNEEPFATIIRLENGDHVLGDECSYRYP